jgi:hypothetical protein
VFSAEDLRFLPGFAEKDLTSWVGRSSSAQPARSPDRSTLRKVYKDLSGWAGEDLPGGPVEDLPGWAGDDLAGWVDEGLIGRADEDLAGWAGEDLIGSVDDNLRLVGGFVDGAPTGFATEGLVGFVDEDLPELIDIDLMGFTANGVAR